MKKKSLPTQFRLSDRERQFLLVRGRGNLAAGLRDVMCRAGYSYCPDEGTPTVKVRRDFDWDNDAHIYCRLDNEKFVHGFKISIMREHSMIQKFGYEFFISEVVLKGLFPLQEDLAKMEQVHNIIEWGGNTEIWRRYPNDVQANNESTTNSLI